MIINGCQDLRTRSASLYVLSDGRTQYHPRGIIAKKKTKNLKLMKHLHSTISIQIIQEMEEHVKYNRINQQKSDCEILWKKCFYNSTRNFKGKKE